jgi:hypothetical protein
MRRLALLAMAVTALAVAAGAEAKIWFPIPKGQTFHNGQLLRTEIIGCAVIKPQCPVAGATVYLAASPDFPTARPQIVSGILGTVDRLGRIKIRLPDAAQGTYRLAARFRRILVFASNDFELVAA